MELLRWRPSDVQERWAQIEWLTQNEAPARSCRGDARHEPSGVAAEELCKGWITGCKIRNELREQSRVELTCTHAKIFERYWLKRHLCRDLRIGEVDKLM